MNKTKQSRYVLLYSICELGGSATKQQVLNDIEAKDYWIFDKKELEIMDIRKEMRWRNEFAFVRRNLVDGNYLDKRNDNTWKITDLGKLYLNELSSMIANADKSDIKKISQDLYSHTREIELQLENSEEQKLQNDIRNEKYSDLIPNFTYDNNPKPKGQSVTVKGRKVYKRDKKISAQALVNANFKCEIDNTHFTFIRKSIDKPYTEPHHLIPMAYTDKFDVSLDREQNIVSLCSNCHNQLHYGKDIEPLLRILYEKRKKLLNSILKHNITFDDLLKLYGIDNDK